MQQILLNELKKAVEMLKILVTHYMCTVNVNLHRY